MERKEKNLLLKIANALTEFGFSIFYTTRNPEDSLCVSPLSIFCALSAVLPGASPTTKREMERVLFLEEGDLQAFQQYVGFLTASEDITLNSATSLWLEQSLTLLKSYKDYTKKSNFETHEINFKGDSEEIIKTVNDWVSEKTKNMIPEILNGDHISSETLMVLINAVYLMAEWEHPFDETLTFTDDFYSLKGPEKTKMMCQTNTSGSLLHTKKEKVEYLKLPYQGGEFSLELILPKENCFDEVASDLGAVLSDLRKSSSINYNICVQMPKFSFESDISLKEALGVLGMETAFSAEKEQGFSEIFDSNLPFRLDDVLHKTRFDVDEKKTEAAAATAVIYRLSAGGSSPTLVKLDRPFFFIVRDGLGCPLFLGQYMGA